ncbi:MAG: HNH endonuclease, partial [Humibacillus sp.]|nr:HNH endonuclease [Humibacillus sp.]MDN5779227.1 HNH endonuclease [Humibacillus sp.]
VNSFIISPTAYTDQLTPPDVAVEVQVVITDDALFGDDDTPGQVPGYGTVPAGWVRDLLTPNDDDPDEREDDETGRGDEAAASAAHLEAATPGHADVIDASPRTTPGRSATTGRNTTQADLRERARVWIRRLYTHPTTGQLVGMDSTRRVFDGGLRKYLLARDAGTCRTPWCDAPIRHLDHIHDHARGGPTTATNGQGLCVRCNHTKQHPGFTAGTITPQTRQPGAPHVVELTTPTGHTYRSTAPPLIPGAAFRRQEPGSREHAADPPLSPFERYLTDLIAS